MVCSHVISNIKFVWHSKVCIPGMWINNLDSLTSANCGVR